MDGGFVIKYYLVCIHKDVETASDVSGEYENRVSDKNRNVDLELSFNVCETFGLPGKDNAKMINFEELASSAQSRLD